MIRLLAELLTMPFDRESRRVDALLTRDAAQVRAAWEPQSASVGPAPVARIGPALWGAGLAAAAVVGLAVVLPVWNSAGGPAGDGPDAAVVAQVIGLGADVRAVPAAAGKQLTDAAQRPILALRPATALPDGREAAAMATQPMQDLTADVETSLRAIARQFPELQRLRTAERG